MKVVPPKASDFLGKSKKKSQDMAEAQNLIYRLIRIDQEYYFSYPDVPIPDCLCIEIDNGKVTKAQLT